MEPSLLMVAAANAAFVVVLGAAGVRLLLLAIRTRQLPELALGGAFVAAVGAIFCLGLSGVGRKPAGDVQLQLLGLAFFLLWIGAAGYSSFTWRAFRPTERWASVVVALLVVTAGAAATSSWMAIWNAGAEESSAEAIRTSVAFLRVPLIIAAAWTAAESIRHYRMERRRLAIGLGNALVSNRFGLWAGAGVFTALNSSVSMALQIQGLGPMHSPLAAAVLSIGGLGNAILMTLALMPPRAYVRHVQRRAAASAA